MEDKTWELLIQDIRDIKEDIKEMKKEVIGLRIKIATFSTLFGAIGAYIKTKFLH